MFCNVPGPRKRIVSSGKYKMLHETCSYDITTLVISDTISEKHLCYRKMHHAHITETKIITTRHDDDSITLALTESMCETSVTTTVFLDDTLQD